MSTQNQPQVINSEVFNFGSETNQLMNLIINSFYSKKDIFLRELISNCSDSLDKLQGFRSQLKSKQTQISKIRISANEHTKVLTVIDNGIGMTKQELIDNIGTIANSDTRINSSRIKDKSQPDSNLIGRFGVGFYSVFLVADKVQIITRSHLDSHHCWSWVSDSIGDYTISQLENKAFIGHGCSVNLYLKEDSFKYLDVFVLRDIIKQYSQYINHIIEMKVPKRIISDLETVTLFNNDDCNSDNNKMIGTWEQISLQGPLWEKDPQLILISEYHHFYKNLTNDCENPLKYKHFQCEGTVDFKSIIFISQKPSIDIFSHDHKKINFHLYSNRVLIMPDCYEVIPRWLSFVNGIVDSGDVPLNISRESLVENKLIAIIKRKIISKSIDLITEIYEDLNLRELFYKNYAKNIKLAIYESEDYKDKMCSFLQFYTSTSGDKLKTFDEYLTNMSCNQKYIFYITGESLKLVEESIFLEVFQEHNIEVIYMIDTIDEYMLQNLKSYRNYDLISVYEQKISVYLPLKFGDQDKFNIFLSLCKEVLPDKIEKVIPSHRLVNSPSCLVSSKDGWTPNMERIMKAQALSGEGYKDYIGKRKIMEINLKHPLIEHLNDSLKKRQDIKKEIELLYNISCLSSGFTIDNMSLICQHLYSTFTYGGPHKEL